MFLSETLTCCSNLHSGSESLKNKNKITENMAKNSVTSEDIRNLLTTFKINHASQKYSALVCY